MANAVYPKALEGLLSGDIDLDANDIRCALVDTGTYTYSASHQFVSDVSTGIVARSGALASKTVTSGTFDAADLTITGVSGATTEALVTFVHTGSDATARLLSYHDGLTLTPDGGNVSVAWNASGIFSI